MTDGPIERSGYVRAVRSAGHLGDPEDVAFALVYLAFDQARFVTGHDIVLDGGQILPERPLGA